MMASVITIRTVVEPEIDSVLDEAICRLQRRAFPHEPLFKLTRHYVHTARQGDLRVLAYAGEQLVAQVVAYQAVASCDAGVLTLACIGNVCSDPDFRGCGAAAQCLDQALGHARWADRQWAMLFCDDKLCGYYRRFGFEPVETRLMVTPPGCEPRPYPKSDTCMVAPLAGQASDNWPSSTLVLDIDVF